MRVSSFLEGLLLLSSAAGALALFGRGFWGAAAWPEVGKGLLLAWALTVAFFLPAQALAFRAGPWFEGLYVTGFLVRLAVLGVLLAGSSRDTLPCAFALGAFLLELSAIAWMARAPRPVHGGSRC